MLFKDKFKKMVEQFCDENSNIMNQWVGATAILMVKPSNLDQLIPASDPLDCEIRFRTKDVSRGYGDLDYSFQFEIKPTITITATKEGSEAEVWFCAKPDGKLIHSMTPHFKVIEGDTTTIQ